MENRQFKIHGLDCAEEIAVLRREIGPIVGGEERLSFDVLAAKMIVASASDVGTDRIIAAVAKTGMRAEPWVDDSVAANDGRQNRRRAVLTGISGGATVVGFLVHAWLAGDFQSAIGSEGMGQSHAVPIPVACIYAIAIAAGVWLVLPKAWYALRRARPDMNLLMVVAVVGAVTIGEWFEAATVSFLFSVSLLLESWSIGRARRAIAALLQLTPTMARVHDASGAEIEVPPASVAVGTSFIVKPGERLPLDGRIAEGTSHINQAPITGESQPVEKSPGDEVFAGTINGDGALVITATKAASNTTLANIVRLVGAAQSRRAPSEQWVDRFAQIYTPAIMALALLIALAPPLLFSQPWSTWIYNALVLLVIACPCALVISTPVSIVAALAAAARQGVLIKGGIYVEIPARLRAIAFDKTGTLTLGKPTVEEVIPLAGHSVSELLERAVALERRSEHPLAEAIIEHGKQQGISASPAADFQVMQGKGATATIDGRKFWIGSHRYLEERQQETPEVHDQLERLASSGRSVVVVGNDEHVCGLITLADRVRDTSKTAIADLKALGIEHLVMLTGDNRQTAEAIAQQVGVDEVLAELLPEDKVTAIESLVARYGNVAMIGDGVNDAPALARATLGIAMGVGGSDAAIETADISLISDNMKKLVWLVRHSRRTLAIVRQNIVFALAVKAVFVLLALFGMASLWAAIAADMGASLLVILNGLRLMRSSNELPRS